MDMMSHLRPINAPLCLCFCLLTITACDPPSSKPTSPDSGLAGDQAGEMTSGEQAGEMTSGEQAGEMTSGEQAGEMTSGEQAGEMTSGEETSGTEAGEMTSGEQASGTEAGEMTSGEQASGTEAGEMTSGEETSGTEAGEMTSGDQAGSEPPLSLCERYCEAFTSQCAERASLKWGEEEVQQIASCLLSCDTSEEGEEGARFGETVACSFHYLSLITEDDQRGCLAGDLDEDRPCFDYEAVFEEVGDYSQILEFGEVARVQFTLTQDTLVHLIATDGDYCIVNDFNLTIYSLEDPMSPELIERVDDYSTEGLDYCPLWLGDLEAGTYEAEIGTYQDQGADLPFEFTLSQPELIVAGEQCLDQEQRLLSQCQEGGDCEEGRCLIRLNEGEPCQRSSEEISAGRCQQELFCYGGEEPIGTCTVAPLEEGDLCALILDHCPIGTSCVALNEQHSCQLALCGDGTQNEGEECDDGNLLNSDGCSSQCLLETRATIAPPADFIEMTGQLSEESESWARPNSDCQAQDPQSAEYFFEPRVITNTTAQPQELTIEAQWREFDGFLHIYRGDYLSGELTLMDPLNQCIIGNDDGVAGFSESTLYNIAIAPQESLTIISSTFECCYVDPSFQGDFRITVRTHGCGDGYLQGDEECDDENLLDGDGCSSTCQIELYCGDMIISDDEECDDGNFFDGDGCSAECTTEELTGYPIQVPPPGITIDPHGAIIEGAPLWERPGTFADPCARGDVGPFAFEYFTLTNSTSFDQVIDINLIPEGEFEDLYLHLFTEPFEPQLGTLGCLTGADGGGDRFVDDRLEGFSIAANESIAVIVSSYDAADPPFGYPGSFQLLITTQEPPLVDHCDMISPADITLVEGEDFSVVTRVSATDRTTQTSGIDDHLFVEVGYGPVGASPDEEQLTPLERQWSWQPAIPNNSWDDLGGEWSGYDEYQGTVVTPAPGEWRVVARASLSGQGWRYCDLGPTEGLQLAETAPLSSLPAQEPRLLINEIDYDQSGGDIAEFIELYNPGPARVDLSGAQLSLFNGNADMEYLSIDLSGGGVLASGEYFIIGSPLVTDLLPEGVRSISLSGTIQNGGADPDGIRIEDQSGRIMDALSYEGSGSLIEGYTEGSGVIDGDDPSIAPNGSLSRCPNGTDSDDNSLDFSLAEQSTPGIANSCP